MRRTRTKRKGKKIGVKFLPAALLVLASGAPICFAQAQAPVIGEPGTQKVRSIVGTVLDGHGAPVPHAIVLLKDMKTLQVRSYIAQDDGSYHFYNLSTDINWQLRAESGGLTSPEKTVDVFNSHKIVKLNLKLKKKLKTS